MQLKLRRTQRDTGILSTSVVFCLDARADLTQQERNNLARYKLYDQVIYNSEAARRHLEKSAAAGADGTARGGLKALAHLAVAAVRLNVTVRSLERGQHIECKSLEELRAAEDAIMEACQNLKNYLEVAATFDGSEMVIDFSGNEPRVVAQAIRPEPILAPPIMELASEPLRALESPKTAAAVFGDSLSLDQESAAADNIVVGSIFQNPVVWLSDFTGFNRPFATCIAIGLVVLVLLSLFALFSMFHG